MTRESFRRNLNREFDAMSGPPSPALSARVRSALVAPRPVRTASRWAAGMAAVLIALIVVGVLVVTNLNRHLSGVGPALTSPSPSAGPSPSPAQTPPDSTLPPFVCASVATLNGTQPPAVAFVDAVRTGTHSGYDRVTIEFKNGEPGSVEVDPKSGTTFISGASGQPIAVAGSAGLLVIIRGSDEHTNYTGPTDLKPNYAVLLELRQVEDFEGTVQWGFGLAKSACYRVFFLTSPARLVIDIQNG